MRGTTTLLAVAALAGALTAPAVARADEAPAADLRMVYGQPEIAGDQSGITWHWTLINNGPAGAASVVATHRVSNGQKIVAVSGPCQDTASDVVCRFGTLGRGERRTGWIRTSIPAGASGLRINAQMTWVEQRMPTAHRVGMKGL